ncbi:hypothetical protein Javan174_0003 [Streptococcus phage Javan174]|uniref:ImmA/IrrE family metallo-endopeptidase n=1 Tax=Streptococcus entericus TaxID=155680 RepID=UPI00037AF75E|nr:ImmA/IrrE family metallo-endopeptidase [Streptococcus entericus]QBX24069.1 hypothetical protein Javan174_0003 [Streptococcus phage Javan174]
MTEKELYNEFGIRISVFDENLLDDDGFYIPDLRTMFISSRIPKEMRHKVTFHELGHNEHLPHLYQIFREKNELDANRYMIRNLVKMALSELDDHTEFNYLTFMEHWQLKSMTDEIMIKEEYKKLVNGK